MKRKKDNLDHLDDKDFLVDPKPLTEAEKKLLSEAIALHKKKSARKNSSKRKHAA
jgi:hypothetical protein